MNLYIVKATDHHCPIDADSEEDAIARYMQLCRDNGAEPDMNANAFRATSEDYRTLQKMVESTFSERLWIAISEDGIEPFYAITRDDAWSVLAKRYGNDVEYTKDSGEWSIRAFNESDWWDMDRRAEDAETELASLQSRLSDIAEEG